MANVTIMPGTTIPRLIHQIWKTSDVDTLPEDMQRLPQTWKEKNPEYRYHLWSDLEAMALVKADYPDFQQAVEALPSGAFRADLFRLIILYHFGGIYADIDTECLRSADNWIGEDGDESARAILGIELAMEDDEDWGPKHLIIRAFSYVLYHWAMAAARDLTQQVMP